MSNPGKPQGFPLPSSLKVVPGTERRRRRIRTTRSSPTADDQRFWFYNSMHFPGADVGVRHGDRGGRLLRAGRVEYPRALPADDAGHRPSDHQRARLHRRQRRHRSGRDRAPHRGVPEARVLLLRELGAALRPVAREDDGADHRTRRRCRSPSCRNSSRSRNVHAGRGVASNHYLLDTYQKTLEGYFRMWHHHFEFLLLGYGAYLTFFDFCKKAFPEITDQTIARMVAGIEAEIFRPDDELRRLARCAVELGVDAHFQASSCPAERLIESLQQRRRAGARLARRSSRSRAIPGSTSMSAMGSITITAPGTTICRCRSRACPDYIERVKAGESLRAAGREAAGRAPAADRGLPGAADHG